MAAKKKTALTGAGGRPSARSADDWVGQGGDTPPPPSPKAKAAPEASTEMKRLAVDLPADIHRRLKLDSVEQGRTMVAIVRELIEAHYND